MHFSMLNNLSFGEPRVVQFWQSAQGIKIILQKNGIDMTFDGFEKFDFINEERGLNNIVYE